MNLADSESSHQDSAHPVRTFGVLVLPGIGIPAACRQHFDVVSFAELLGQEAARMLGARRDISTITRRNEGESHKDRPMVERRAEPVGSRSSTSAAGGRVLWWRAKNPGSGSIVRRAGLALNRSNISRYFPSITGHA